MEPLTAAALRIQRAEILRQIDSQDISGAVDTLDKLISNFYDNDPQQCADNDALKYMLCELLPGAEHRLLNSQAPSGQADLLFHHFQNVVKLTVPLVHLNLPGVTEMLVAIIGGYTDSAAMPRATWNSASSAHSKGFYALHGRCILRKGWRRLGPMWFWPDERALAARCGGLHFVGLRLRVYFQPTNVQNVVVVEMNIDTFEHLLAFEDGSEKWCHLGDVSFDVLGWVKDTRRQLNFAADDVGQRVEVWWPNKQKYMTGTVVDWDPADEQPLQIFYDNGSLTRYNAEQLRERRTSVFRHIDQVATGEERTTPPRADNDDAPDSATTAAGSPPADPPAPTATVGQQHTVPPPAAPEAPGSETTAVPPPVPPKPAHQTSASSVFRPSPALQRQESVDRLQALTKGEDRALPPSGPNSPFSQSAAASDLRRRGKYLRPMEAGQQRASMYLYAMLEFFGQQGGFVALAQALGCATDMDADSMRYPFPEQHSTNLADIGRSKASASSAAQGNGASAEDAPGGEQDSETDGDDTATSVSWVAPGCGISAVAIEQLLRMYVFVLPMCHSSFEEQYSHLVFECTARCLVNMHDAQLRTLNKTVLATILRCIDSLALRFPPQRAVRAAEEELVVGGVHAVNADATPTKQSIRMHVRNLVDELRLWFALRLMKSGQLDKRLLGLAELKLFVDKAKAPPPPAYNRNQQSDFPSREWMCEWLQWNRVVEDVLYASSVHTQVAVRSQFVLEFLGNANRLKESHFTAIWEAARNSRGELTEVLYSHVVCIAKQASVEDIKKMNASLQDVDMLPVADCALVQLLEEFTLQAAKKQVQAIISGATSMAKALCEADGVALDGNFPNINTCPVSIRDAIAQYFKQEVQGMRLLSLERLWTLMQDPMDHPALAIDVTESACAALFGLLQKLYEGLNFKTDDPWASRLLEEVRKLGDEARKRYLFRCVDCVHHASAVSVPQCLRLLSLLLTSEPVDFDASTQSRLKAMKRLWSEPEATAPSLWKLVNEKLRGYGTDMMSAITLSMQRYSALVSSEQSTLVAHPRDDSALWRQWQKLSSQQQSDSDGQSFRSPFFAINHLRLQNTSYTHLQQLEYRLDFLAQCFTTGGVQVAPLKIEDARHPLAVLWRLCVTDCRSPESLDLAMTWFADPLVNEQSSLARTDDYLEWLAQQMRHFTEQFPGRVTPYFGQLFCSVFLRVNRSKRFSTVPYDMVATSISDVQGRLVPCGNVAVLIGASLQDSPLCEPFFPALSALSTTATRLATSQSKDLAIGMLMIRDADLQHIQTLWRLAINCTNEHVVRQATALLIDVALRADEKEKVGALVQSSFVKHALQFLHLHSESYERLHMKWTDIEKASKAPESTTASEDPEADSDSDPNPTAGVAVAVDATDAANAPPVSSLERLTTVMGMCSELQVIRRPISALREFLEALDKLGARAGRPSGGGKEQSHASDTNSESKVTVSVRISPNLRSKVLDNPRAPSGGDASGGAAPDRRLTLTCLPSDPIENLLRVLLSDLDTTLGSYKAENLQLTVVKDSSMSRMAITDLLDTIGSLGLRGEDYIVVNFEPDIFRRRLLARKALRTSRLAKPHHLLRDAYHVTPQPVLVKSGEAGKITRLPDHAGLELFEVQADFDLASLRHCDDFMPLPPVGHSRRAVSGTMSDQASTARITTLADAANGDLLTAKPDMTLHGRSGSTNKAVKRGSATSKLLQWLSQDHTGDFELLFNVLTLQLPRLTNGDIRLGVAAAQSIGHPNSSLTVDDAQSDIAHAKSVLDQLCGDAWRILVLLPTKPMTLKTMRSLMDAKRLGGWHYIIDTRSTYTLLYSLQIIDAFACGSAEDAPLASVHERAAWCKKFIYHGGIDFLVGLLSEAETKLSGPAFAGAVAYILRILHGFLLLDPAYVDVDFDAVGVDAGRQAATGDNTRAVPGSRVFFDCHGLQENGFAPIRELRKFEAVADGTLVAALNMPSVVDSILSVMVHHAKRLHEQRHSAEHGSHGHSLRTGSRVAGGEDGVAYYGMLLLTGCVLSRADSLRALCSHSQLIPWLRVCTLRASSATRFVVSQAIYRICKFMPCVVDFTKRDFSGATHPAAVKASFRLSSIASLRDNPELSRSDVTLQVHSLDSVPVDSGSSTRLCHSSPDYANPAHQNDVVTVLVPVHEFFLRQLLALFGVAQSARHTCGHYFALVAALIRMHADLDPQAFDSEDQGDWLSRQCEQISATRAAAQDPEHTPPRTPARSSPSHDGDSGDSADSDGVRSSFASPALTPGKFMAHLVRASSTEHTRADAASKQPALGQHRLKQSMLPDTHSSRPGPMPGPSMLSHSPFRESVYLMRQGNSTEPWAGSRDEAALVQSLDSFKPAALFHPVDPSPSSMPGSSTGRRSKAKISPAQPPRDLTYPEDSPPRPPASSTPGGTQTRRPGDEDLVNQSIVFSPAAALANSTPSSTTDAGAARPHVSAEEALTRDWHSTVVAPITTINIEGLFRRCMQALVFRSCTETFYSSATDYLMSGLMLLARYLLESAPHLRRTFPSELLIQYVFRVGLFPCPADMTSAPRPTQKGRDWPADIIVDVHDLLRAVRHELGLIQPPGLPSPSSPHDAVDADAKPAPAAPSDTTDSDDSAAAQLTETDGSNLAAVKPQAVSEAATRGESVGDARPTDHTLLYGSKLKSQTSRSVAFGLLLDMCADPGLYDAQDGSAGASESIASAMEREWQAAGAPTGVPSHAWESSNPRLTALLHVWKFVHECGGLGQLGHDQWNLDPTRLTKTPGSFVGLKNQGATCYMNSLFQQLFAVPEFRHNLLCMKTQRDSETDPADDTLYQLQVLFGSLLVSPLRYLDTMPLCRTFRDFDGEPVRMSEQKDANEFAMQLFSALEASSSKAQRLIKDTFVGTVLNQIISKGRTYKSEREEPFYMITVPVKGESSIADSLKTFVKGEELTGDNQYQMPNGEKVDAIKRVCLKDLPPHMILHLKRFDFDLDTLQRTKLNSYCSIPFTINMRRYTVQGIEEAEAAAHGSSEPAMPAGRHDTSTETPASRSSLEPASTADAASIQDEKPVGHEATRDIRPDWYYQYELRGVIAHMGTANSGHYYSFIKIRDDPRSGGAAGDASAKARGWYEFNDRLVRRFDPENIPSECFGGEDEVQTGTTASGQPIKETQARVANAYMVVYDRVRTPAAAAGVRTGGMTPGPLQRQSSIGSVWRRQHSIGSEADSHFRPRFASVGAMSRASSIGTEDFLDGLMSSPAASAGGDSAPTCGPGVGALSFVSRAYAKYVRAVRRKRRADHWLPPHVLRGVWHQHRELLLERNLFCGAFIDFIWRAIHLSISSASLVHRTLWRSPPISPMMAQKLIDDDDDLQLPPPANGGTTLGTTGGAKGATPSHGARHADALDGDELGGQASASVPSQSELELRQLQTGTRFLLDTLTHASVELRRGSGAAGVLTLAAANGTSMRTEHRRSRSKGSSPLVAAGQMLNTRAKALNGAGNHAGVSRLLLPGVREWVASMKYAFGRNAQAASWFTEAVAEGAESDWLRGILLHCTSVATRRTFAGLVLHCAAECRGSNLTPYHTTGATGADGSDASPSDSHPVAKLIRRLCGLIEHELPEHMANAAETYWLLYKVLKLGQRERLFLASDIGLHGLIEFVNTPHTAVSIHGTTVSTVAAPSSRLLVEAIASVVLECRVEPDDCGLSASNSAGAAAVSATTVVQEPAPATPLLDTGGLVDEHVLGRESTRAVLQPAFLRAVMDLEDPTVAVALFNHLSRDSVEASKAIVDIFKQRITAVSARSTRAEVTNNVFYVIDRVLVLRDSMQDMRAEWVAEQLLKSLHTVASKAVPGDERFVQAASRTLLYTISHFPSSFQYVATYSEQLPRWLEPFKRMAKAKSAGNGLFSRILGSGTPGTPSGGDYGAQKR